MKDYFECECRGKITAKGKGEVEMYFVNGARTELSVSLERTENTLQWGKIEISP